MSALSTKATRRFRAVRACALVGCASAAWLVGCDTNGITVYREEAAPDAAPLPACADTPPAAADRAPGKPTVMLPTTEVAALVADERELFVSAVYGGRRGVFAIPKQGGEARMLVSKLHTSLDSDGPWLYGDGERIEKATGATLSYGNDLRYVGHDATSVLFVRLDKDLVRANKDGASAIEVVVPDIGASGDPKVYGDHVYWVARLRVEQYRASSTALLRVSTRGGEVEKVVRDGLGDAIAVDCNYVHVSLDGPTAGTRELARMKLGGGPIVSYAAVPPGGTLFLDAKSAYLVSESDIRRVSLATGTVDVVKGPYSPRLFAMGDDAVYWTGPEGVVRAPK